MSVIASQSIDVKSLISQLTLEEKISLLAGQNFWETAPVKRLGIPSLKVTDGPNGARGSIFADGIKAACFPASVSLASTWDRKLARKIGNALAEEARTKGASIILGPTVCPHRHPLGGRNFESFSEDPLLGGVLSGEYITGLQERGVGACIKHFVANEEETRRFTMDSRVSQRALRRELYLKPFEIAIKASQPWAVMTSYNLVNGIHSDSSKFLLEDILRVQWGWKGLVMSDWGGTNSVAESLLAGLDLEMPGPAEKRTNEKVTAALKEGTISVEVIDKRVGAVLDLLAQAGKFADPTVAEEQAIDRPEHRQLIREAGTQGIVLLKNENAVLPLKRGELKSIAMLGLAKECLASGGGSATVNAHYKVTPWDAVSHALGKDVDLRFAEGECDFRNLKPLSLDTLDDEGKPGLTLQGYSSKDRTGTPDIKNIESATYRNFEGVRHAAITMTGTYIPSQSGSHYLAFHAIADTTVFINDVVVFSVSGSGVDAMAFLLGVATADQVQYEFIAGQKYSIRIQSSAASTNASGLSILNDCIGFSLGFMLQSEYEADLLTPAISLAKESDIALVFVGHTTVWETEGTDRDTMSLPANGSLDRLISEVAAVNRNTIVINCTGSAISMPWIHSVPAIIQAWFPGQEAGNSIIDVLLGDKSPSGKLPVTFPKSLEVCPAYGNFPGDLEKNQVEYKEDIYIGYRYFDSHAEDVLFPFGHGLSYTSFKVGEITLDSKEFSIDTSLKIKASVTNTGTVAGAEVLQLYVGPANSLPIKRPKKQLADFVKVDLEPGEKKEVWLSFEKSNLAYWDEERDVWVVDAGSYNASVGTSSTDIHDTQEFVVLQRFEFGP
ncbi:glycoside hydrolase superfamily [Bisporella sp. PMI_857]|nr:glycoside hydrolase superfamily [Bisporella sp. PMI_857]